MDKNALHELDSLAKALKAALVRSQSGISALLNITKLGPSAMAASSPTIFNELRQLELDMQKGLRSYKDLLHKAFISVTTDAEKEP